MQKNFKLFAFSSVFLGLLLVALIVFQMNLSSLEKNYTNSSKAFNDVPSLPSSTPFITQTEVSGPRVDEETVAKKVNLQRKLIIPQSEKEQKIIQKTVEKAGGTIVKSETGVVVAEIPSEIEQAVMAELHKQEAAKSVEVDYPVFVTGDAVDWGTAKIEAPAVWDTTQALGVKVAVVDTGVDYTHPDLRGRYAGGYDVVNGDTDPFDDNGHGTHVSGIIVADANEAGYEGVAPQASILGVKVLAADGTGYLSDIIKGLDWAASNGARVVNLSLGTTYDSTALRAKVDELSAKGIIVVASAGNTSGGPLLYPAGYGSVISVAATDADDQFASFSSLGAELAAPGVGITSTVPGGGYASWSGTSMAAPHVSATVALMLANNQTNIRTKLHETAVDAGPAGKDNFFGYGRIFAKPAALGQDVLAPAVTFSSPQNKSEVSGMVSIMLDVQDEHKIASVSLQADGKKLQEWTQSPYTFLWDAGSVPVGSVIEFFVTATDDSGNVGGARISVKTTDALPSPPVVSTVSASPKMKQNKEATPSAKIPEPNYGNSGEVRRDVEHRNENSLQENRSNFPEVTNMNQRNPQPSDVQNAQTSQKNQENKEEKPQNSGNDQKENAVNDQQQREKEKNKNASENGKVKGVSTDISPYSILKQIFLLFSHSL